MRTLHVAALPYPSPQGTQGILHAMLNALAAAGHDAHLLCYPHGAGNLRQHGYTVHRAPGGGRGGSLRSGPSLEKLRLDVALARGLAELTRRLEPAAIVAHHVEAAACALLLKRRPVLFVAHTALAGELETYLPHALAVPARRAGAAIDVSIVRRASRSLAVSPLLAALLGAASGRPVHALPIPWPTSAPPTPEERAAARARLDIQPAHQVALYAGNLDGYQGLAPMLSAIAELSQARPRLRLVVATCSSAGPLARALAAARAQVVPLASEADRRLVHAAADLALVPRRSPGGIPIKLLDALGRGVPVVAARRALAGLPLDPYCAVVPDGSAAAFRACIDGALAALPALRARALDGRAHLATVHAPARFAASLSAHLAAVA